jgi:hypothetical protein
MAQFAHISSDNTVINLISIPDEYINQNYPDLSDSDLVDQLFSWIQEGEYIIKSTGDKNQLRPAMIGGTYNKEVGHFTDAKPQAFPSWILKNGEWVPPISRPISSAPGWPESDVGLGWYWDEELLQWKYVQPTVAEDQ